MRASTANAEKERVGERRKTAQERLGAMAVNAATEQVRAWTMKAAKDILRAIVGQGFPRLQQRE